MSCVTNRKTHLSTWVDEELKRKFSAVAASRGISESAFLKQLVELALIGVSPELAVTMSQPTEARGARITVRLVPGDWGLLRERAAARGMRAATYVSTLTRAHLRSLSPLPDREIAALQGIAVHLATMGRNIRSIALPRPPQQALPRITRASCSSCAKQSAITSVASCAPTPEAGRADMGKELPGLDEPLLDIVSLARRGPNGRLSPKEISLVVRTLRRTPEVMVKVSGGARSTAGAVAHLKYIDRHGDLELETDEGEKLKGGDAERTVVEDWDLDVLAARSRAPYRGTSGRKPSKLLHNIVLSMPAGTSPAKLLAASRSAVRNSR